MIAYLDKIIFPHTEMHSSSKQKIMFNTSTCCQCTLQVLNIIKVYVNNKTQTSSKLTREDDVPRNSIYNISQNPHQIEREREKNNVSHERHK